MALDVDSNGIENHGPVCEESSWLLGEPVEETGREDVYRREITGGIPVGGLDVVERRHLRLVLPVEGVLESGVRVDQAYYEAFWFYLKKHIEPAGLQVRVSDCRQLVWVDLVTCSRLPLDCNIQFHLSEDDVRQYFSDGYIKHCCSPALSKQARLTILEAARLGIDGPPLLTERARQQADQKRKSDIAYRFFSRFGTRRKSPTDTTPKALIDGACGITLDEPIEQRVTRFDFQRGRFSFTRGFDLELPQSVLEEVSAWRNEEGLVRARYYDFLVGTEDAYVRLKFWLRLFCSMRKLCDRVIQRLEREIADAD